MHVVVDGSNLATEGRTLPSLKQLIEGVLDFRGENPEAEVVVVVDATFGHRIDDAERPQFEDAVVHQEIVSPPAGAIGRGDAFVLRIAEKVGATVLSNDSFQEFHAEHDWLFDPGRLIGGKPVPGIGWIFTPRTPVRGPRSREVTQEAKRKQRRTTVSSEAPLVSGAELLEKGKAALDKLPKGRRDKPKKDESRGRESPKVGHRDESVVEGVDEVASSGPRRNRRSRGPVENAIALATVEAVVPDLDDQGGKRRKRRRKAAPLGEPVNEPGVFLELVAAYRPGEMVEGIVEQFSSHGAFITVQGARCYVPLSLLGDPPPRAARDVLKRGEVRSFVLRAFDAARRGVELALPGIHLPVGPVADETAAAAVGAEAPEEAEPTAVPASRGRRPKKAALIEAGGVDEPSRARRPKKVALPAAGAELASSRPRRAPKVAEVAEVETVPRRPRGAKKPVTEVTEATADVAATPVAPSSRRRGANKAAAEVPAMPVEPAVQGQAEKAPARKKAPARPRKTAATNAPIVAPEPVTEPAATKRPPPRRKAAAPTVVPVEVAAPPRKRAAKAAAPWVAPEPAVVAAPPRPRASRKAKPAVEQPAATMALEEPAPVKAPRRRATKAAAPGQDPAPVTPPAKVPSKRGSAKKAPSA